MIKITLKKFFDVFSYFYNETDYNASIKEATVKKTYNTGLLNFTSFKIKKIVDGLGYLNYYVNSKVFKQYKNEKAITDFYGYLEPNLVLFDELNTKLNIESQLWLNASTDKIIKFNHDCIVLKTPLSLDYFSINVPGVNFDNYNYYFKCYYEFLDSNAVYKKLSTYVLPYRYAGDYLEEVLFSDAGEYECFFDALENFSVSFYDTYNNKIDCDYEFSNSKLIVKNTYTAHTKILVKYQPNFESNKIKVNGKLLKVTLETNCDLDKKLILFGGV